MFASEQTPWRAHIPASKQLPSWRNPYIAVPFAFSVCLNVVLLLRVAHTPQGIACKCHCGETQALADVAFGSLERAVAPAPERAYGRQLAGSSGGGSSASHGSGSSSSGSHPQDALLFLFNTLVVGVAIMHLNSKFPSLQLTVALFVLGMVLSLVIQGFNLEGKLGVFGKSYEMWMAIDPHLLLFTLLPALLAGDAMTIDTSVAKRVGYQCLYLAGPGVIVQAMIVASFLYGYMAMDSNVQGDAAATHDWDFKLCLITGSILCATDPVAVVALLKELGASPMLTVQIQGESLLNDGTAIVVFLVSYNMMAGTEYDAAGVLMFLVKTAGMAWALGMFIGYFFFAWIRGVSNRLNHSSSTIQISLTICCAYWSFVLAEGVLKLSGVLACVAASLVLAHHMWPHIVSPESVHHVWHTIESLGNTIIFFLAGALTGEVMVHVPAMAYLDLVAIYAVLLIVRSAFLFVSLPMLKCLHVDKLPVTLPEAMVMAWGGLRGAVGLALAIQVHNERAKDDNGVYQISEDDGRLVLFYVSGVACLTTIVNATTAPMLVIRLGITALPRAQRRLLRMLHERLVKWSEASHVPPQVTEALRDILDHVKLSIDKTPVKTGGELDSVRESIREKSQEDFESPELTHGPTPPASAWEKKADALSVPLAAKCSAWSKTLSTLTDANVSFQDNCEIIRELKESEEAYRNLPKKDLKLFSHLGGIPEHNMLGKVTDLMGLIDSLGVDIGMARVVNRAFMLMVQANYWKQIEAGDLLPGSDEVDALLTSVRVSLSPLTSDLSDWDVISNSMPKHPSIDIEKWWKVFPEDPFGAVLRNGTSLRIFKRIVKSSLFNLVITVAILLNCLYVALDEAFRSDDNKDDYAWLVVEILFLTIFVIEFILKILALGFGYFQSGPNWFDFALVVFGIAGVTSGILARESDGSEVQGSEARIIKIARVFRALRLLRVFRLLNAKLNSHKNVSSEVAMHMKRLTTLKCFTSAHLLAQNQLVKYFGVNSKIDEIDEAEMARCILQSQVFVYRAIFVAVAEEQRMDSALLDEVSLLIRKKRITEKLERFIMSAHSDGAISARDAEAILHPLCHSIHETLVALQDLDDGIFATRRMTSLELQDTFGVVPTPSSTSSLPPGLPGGMSTTGIGGSSSVPLQLPSPRDLPDDLSDRPSDRPDRPESRCS